MTRAAETPRGSLRWQYIFLTCDNAKKKKVKTLLRAKSFPAKLFVSEYIARFVRALFFCAPKKVHYKTWWGKTNKPLRRFFDVCDSPNFSDHLESVG
jgi:hypothetical protein